MVEQWVKAKKDFFDFDKIGMYAELKKDNNFHQLSSQTKTDIDFNDVFCLIDRTTSKVGQQFLYAILSNPTNDKAALLKLNEQIIFFTDNEALNIDVQLQLLKLNNDDAYFLPSLLTADIITKPHLYKYVFISLITIPLIAIVSVLYPMLLFWILVPLTLNMFIHYRNKNYTKRFNKLFQQLDTLINCSKILNTKQLPIDNNLVESSAGKLKNFQRKIKLLGIDGGSIKDELTQASLYLYEILKAFFLIEFFAFYSVLKDIDNKQDAILYLFK